MGVKLMGRQGMIWLNVFYVHIKFEEWKKKKKSFVDLEKVFLEFQSCSAGIVICEVTP